MSPSKSDAATSPTSHPASAPAVSRPFVISEANLPSGFPEPGPVGVVILKKYPACREARVEAPGNNSNDMFMTLFRHIQSNNISMTAPVEITWGMDAATQPVNPVAMAFIYHDSSIGTPGTHDHVNVIDLPAMSVLSVGIRGGFGKEQIEPAVKMIDQYLADHAWQYKPIGPVRYLGYNSPFVPPFMRFGEVQLPVQLR